MGFVPGDAARYLPPMRVLLAHGLARTPLSLAGLARVLERAGHTTRSFGYFAFAESYDDIRARLVAELAEMAADPAPVGLVGHSLGGLLLRHALADVPSLNVHRLIMLGTPNRSPRSAQTRGSVGTLADLEPQLRRTARVTRGLRTDPGAARAVHGDRRDGGLAESEGPLRRRGERRIRGGRETKIVDSDVPELFPVLHTFMMNDERVQGRIGELLQG